MSAPGHASVMLAEVVDGLTRAGEGLVAPRLVDCTLGGAGHARALLEACPEAELLGLDRDAVAIQRCHQVLAPFAGRVDLVHADYRDLARLIEKKTGRASSAGSLQTSGSRAFSSPIRLADSPSLPTGPSTCVSTRGAVRQLPISWRNSMRMSSSRSFGRVTNRTRDASLGRFSRNDGGTP